MQRDDLTVMNDGEEESHSKRAYAASGSVNARKDQSGLRRVKRTVLYEGSALDYCHDQMVLPDGSRETWDFIHHRRGGGACVIPVLPDGRILMIRQFRPSVDRTELELPAGARLHPGEDASETAERELREETGFTAGKMTHLATLRTAVAWCDETTELFLAEDLKKDGDQILDPAEEIAVGAFDLDELYAMILDGRIDDAKTVAGLFGYLAVRGRASSH